MSKKSIRDITDSVSEIPFVGKSRAKAFEHLGIMTVEDLLFNLPRQVVDFSCPVKIKDLKLGDKKPILCRVSQIKQNRTFRKKMSITRSLLSDNSGSIEAVWFNQPYLTGAFKTGNEYLFFGEVRPDKYTGRMVCLNPQFYKDAGVYPIYAQTENLTSRQISQALRNAIDAGYVASEYLPSDVLKKNNLPDIQTAIFDLHFPKKIDRYKKAKSRIILNKLIELILANLLIKKENEKSSAKKINVSEFRDSLDRFVEKLPFELTADQLKASSEILSDLQKARPMNRIVQGDVGSGKTIVGVIASLPIIWSGQKAVWLSPTQVLANQHYKNIKKLVGKKIKVSLFTGASKKGDIGKSDLIIGTHALIQKGVKIDSLGLVIVDEQHRFGVKQRENLKSKNKKEIPHFLSLTATPIPRTLSHIIFGNCDISIIYSKPVGRKKIKTFIIPESKRDSSYRFIDKLIEAGQKAFIICPAIGAEFDPEGDKKAVVQEAERVKATVIGKRNIRILHGKMKPKEKEESFRQFAFGKAQVLVSTSVVEVGVDVPEATAMIVEDAHNFGLAQLHQFRGRIGRSDLQSYCFCFSRNLDNSVSRERLKVFVQNDNGFKLAQHDLKLRGPGALLGLNQSGFSGINPIWLEDTSLLLRAKKIADLLMPIMKSDKYLYNKVKSKLKTRHLE